MARRSPLLLGGLKSQVGHLEGAAGIAGLIKAILVLRHRHAPAQAGFDTPNPRFRWDGAGMEVPRTGRDLPAEGGLVAISSFGISGTNAHAVLAPAPEAKPARQPDRMRVLTLSARSPAALGRLAAAYDEPLGPSGPALRDLCYTASVRREHWDQRLALVGASREEMAAARARACGRRAVRPLACRHGGAEEPSGVPVSRPGRVAARRGGRAVSG